MIRRRKDLYRRLDLLGMPWQLVVVYDDVIGGREWVFYQLVPLTVPNGLVRLWALWREVAFLIWRTRFRTCSDHSDRG